MENCNFIAFDRFVIIVFKVPWFWFQQHCLMSSPQRLKPKPWKLENDDDETMMKLFNIMRTWLNNFDQRQELLDQFEPKTVLSLPRPFCVVSFCLVTFQRLPFARLQRLFAMAKARAFEEEVRSFAIARVPYAWNSDDTRGTFLGIDPTAPN